LFMNRFVFLFSCFMIYWRNNSQIMQLVSGTSIISCTSYFVYSFRGLFMAELKFNMLLLDVNITILVSIFIAVMFLLIISFLLAFIFSQRRKYHYRQEVQMLHGRQQNQLIEAAVRSEELERHRISEELHDEVG